MEIEKLRRPSRVPVEVAGLQVNYCRNTLCSNFGVTPGERDRRNRSAAAQDPAYVMTGGAGALMPTATCGLCKESFPLKSNLAVAEEMARLSAYLAPIPELGCPDQECAHWGKAVSTHPKLYQGFGSTSAGSRRFRCKHCTKLFSIPTSSTPRQKRPDVNALVYRLLINKMPMRRICETAGIGPQTLYTKLEFIAERARAFAREQESQLLRGKALPPLLLSTDRQDYLLNWGTSADRRNTRLHGVGTADNRSSYVFGMHLDYDSRLDPGDIELAALECDDYGILPPFRTFARLWLKRDWNSQQMIQRRRYGAAKKRGIAVAELDEEVQSPKWGGDDTKLPGRGMKVRDDYSVFGHLHLIAQLTAGSPHVALYMDLDPGLRAAAHTAFREKILEGRADTFQVRINKDMTIDTKSLAVAQAKQRMARFARERGIEQAAASRCFLEEHLSRRGFVERWQDRWVDHPSPDQGEPEKSLLHLTDRPDLTDARRADLHLWGSLHGIDRFFMVLRRRQSLLERPISSASSSGRTFMGNNPYRPWVVEAVLDLLRVSYNFHHVGKDKKTPAQRLGLADRGYALEDILAID